jgi:hypothetical protein
MLGPWPPLSHDGISETLLEDKMNKTELSRNGSPKANIFGRLGLNANDQPAAVADLNGGLTIRPVAGDDPVARRTPVTASPAQHEEVPGPILIMQRTLYDHAKARAIDSAALTPQTADIEALENHARAMARETQRELYDPTLHAHDQMRQAEYDKNLAERADGEVAEKHALIAMRQREDDLAEVHPGDEPATPSRVLPAAAVIGLALTIAPTLHDQIFATIDDEFLAWTLSLAGGLFLALLIVLMILDPSDERSVTNWIGLAAGVLIGIALGALRLRDAKDFGDYIFALALTLLEIAIVIGVEAVAGRRRAERRVWKEKKSIADKARGLLDAAREHVRRSKEKVKELNEAITAHHLHVEHRHLSNVGIAEIEASALGAVRDGYRAGIAANHGQTLRPRKEGHQ